MIQRISIIAKALAVAGVLCNNHRKRVCFIIWMVSNSMAIGIHIYAGLYGMALGDAVFLVLAVQGWILWGSKKG